MELFESFPYLENDKIIIRKMEEEDVNQLEEITNNPNVYRYVPYLLYQKSRGNLLAAIRNIGKRDFEKKRYIIAGIYLRSNPGRLVGMAEMFDYRKRAQTMTIGYRLNERFWNQGIATSAVTLMTSYLLNEMKLSRLVAEVMPENIYSGKALQRNGFMKLPERSIVHDWGGRESVEVDIYYLDK